MAPKNRKDYLLSRAKRRIRKKISGTPERPRLRVTRSLKHIYAQLIDDASGTTLAAASSVSLKVNGGNVDGAKAVGKAIGDKAKEKSITMARFDRGGHIYHGRIQALADAAREAGLEF